MSIKKCFFVGAFLGMLVLPLLSNAPKAQALTVDEIRAQIVALQQQILLLQQQLEGMEAEEEVWCYDFHLNLKYGMAGEEVRALQTALEKEGFYKRTVSGTFDEYTGSAVVGFQEKYKAEILSPWGLEHGTGYVGRTTLARLNALYGCGKRECLEEGKWVPDENRTCCGGLKLIEGAYCGEDRPEGLSIQRGWICINCGNGVCGLGENWCNCSQDCPREEEEPFCSDSDGGRNLYQRGTIRGNSYSSLNADELAHGEGSGDTKNFTEYCRDANTVTEFYCTKPEVAAAVASGKEIVAVPYQCEHGCENGACNQGAGITIISPNGGEVWNSGGTYAIKWSAPDATRIVIDVLGADGKTVYTGMPAVLSNSGSYQWTIPSAATAPAAPKVGNYKVKIYVCPSFLSESACANIDLTDYGYDTSDGYFSIAEPAVSACNDSDGGKDYYTKGVVVVDGVKSLTDSCLTGITLEEYYCRLGTSYSGSGAASEGYGCVYGCQNGACKKGITVKSPNGGEVWVAGQKYDIKWYSQGVVENVEIYLRDDRAGSDYTLIATEISSSLNKYSWSIPIDLGLSSTHSPVFKIQVRKISGKAGGGPGEGIYDESNNYFSIVEPVTCVREVNGVRCGGYLYEDYCENLPDGTGYVNTRKCNASEGSDCSTLVNVDRTFCQYGCQNVACKKGIRVVDPNGGEKWLMGKTYDILWSASGLDKVNIVLLDYRAGRSYLTIATDVSASSGRYSWTIPTDVFQGGNYAFGIWIGEYKPPVQSGDWEPLAAMAEATIYDESDNYFSIPKYVKVISPNGGEQWLRGETYTIEWNSPETTRVVIDILDQATGKVASVSTEIPAVLPNAGSYQWIIPSAMPAGNYKVKIYRCSPLLSELECANSDLSFYGYDESDNSFTITE